MQKTNPYNIMFGMEPPQTISRAAQLSEVINSFRADRPSQMMYMITGVRGVGKTVFMTEVSKELANDKDWIIINLNSSGNLLEDMAASLASENKLAVLFRSAGTNLSVFGIGLEVKNKDSVPITNIQVALTKMLQSLKRKGKRVLVCIDEVTVTEHMKVFAGAYQIFLREDLPLFLLMTGLFENINDLQNEKNLTFLYRAPRLPLKPLNITNITMNYMKNLEVDNETATKMARLTRGYSFAFQVLGYFMWNHKGDYEGAVSDTRTYLDEYVYEKIWSGLSEKDKRFVNGVANTEDGKASAIKKASGFSDEDYSVYRDRLIKRGVVNGDTRGYLKFTLPMFEDYVRSNYLL